MATRAFPDAPAISEILTMLIGKQVRVARRGTPHPLTGRLAAVTYVRDGDEIVFAGVMDVAFIAVMGAALAMFPRSVVDEAIKNGVPSAGLVENAQEVMNVCASLFNDDANLLHVTVRPILLTPPPADLKKWTLGPKARLDVDVGIAGYPDSKLTFVHVR